MKAAQFEILCDEATARAARRVEFHDLGERTFRGWTSLSRSSSLCGRNGPEQPRSTSRRAWWAVTAS